MSPVSALGPNGERQDQLDAIDSFAGAGWAGDLSEECRFRCF